MSAVGDPHVSTVTSASFDLWRTGWSTFVQVPLASVDQSKFFWSVVASDCTEVRINGLWLRSHDAVVHSGSLKSPNPFYVILGGGEPLYLQHNGAIAFVKENAGSLRRWISTDNGWGRDAGVELLTDFSISGHLLSILRSR